MDTPMMTKSSDKPKLELRKQMRERLGIISTPDMRTASAAACARLASLEAFERANIVMLYMPLADEVDLTPLALRAYQLGKTLCVPHVDWKREDMYPVEATSFDDESMEMDERGLRRPRHTRPIPESVLDLVVVPGLAFDTNGQRLGRGGGFYDRFLSRLRRQTVLVGIAFDQQIIDAVPKQDHDIPMHVVVTDRRVVHDVTRSGRRC